ncbi:MAG: hypothetical protein R2731_06695 [Nocardioides sp.]
MNRHPYTRAELEAALARPVVQALLRLIRFRNTHPAFDGQLAVDGGGDRLRMAWTAGEERAVLGVDLRTAVAQVTWTDGGATRMAEVAELP